MLLLLDTKRELAYENETWGDMFARIANSPSTVTFSFDRQRGVSWRDARITVLIDLDCGAGPLNEIARAFGCRDFTEFQHAYAGELSVKAV